MSTRRTAGPEASRPTPRVAELPYTRLDHVLRTGVAHHATHSGKSAPIASPLRIRNLSWKEISEPQSKRPRTDEERPPTDYSSRTERPIIHPYWNVDKVGWKAAHSAGRLSFAEQEAKAAVVMFFYVPDDQECKTGWLRSFKIVIDINELGKVYIIPKYFGPMFRPTDGSETKSFGDHPDDNEKYLLFDAKDKTPDATFDRFGEVQKLIVAHNEDNTQQPGIDVTIVTHMLAICQVAELTLSERLEDLRRW